jgi:hypothetical protein
MLRNKALTFVRDDLIAKEAVKQKAKNPSLTDAQAKAAAQAVVTPEDIRKSFNGFLHIADGGVKSLLAGATVSKDVDALMKRGVIPKEIRQMWGEYTDPTVNAAKSLGAVAQYVTQNTFLTNLVDLGTTEGWLSKEKFDANGERLYELAPNNGMSGRYNGTPNTQWAPLSGYYGPRALADAIAANPPHATRMTKRLLRAAQTAELSQILEMAGAMQALAHATADHDEAITAFFDRRPPHFKGD